MSIRRLRVIPFVLVLLAVLASCGGQAAPSATATPTTPPASSYTGTITLETTGGIAGIREVLVIDPKGAVSFSTRSSAQGDSPISAERLAELRSRFEAAGFMDLNERYDQGNIADDIYDTITFQGSGATKSVTVAQVGGEQLAPAPLKDLISLLREIRDEVRSRPTPVPTQAP